MALTASELLQQRMERDKRDLQKAFEQEWSIASRRFGPNAGNPQIEAERQRALFTIHQRYSAKANSLLSDYEAKARGFSEVDAMTEQGMISANPEEVKMRMILPPDVEKAAFPKEEEGTDPVAEYGRLDVQRNRVQGSLKRFEREAPGKQRAPVAGVFRRGSIKTQGGGVLVVEDQYDEKQGKVIKVRRNANAEERREWAELTEHDRQLAEAMSGIRSSDAMASRIRLAAVRSRRMGNAGTFAEKATGMQPGKETQTYDFGKMSDEELMKLAGVR